MNMSMSSTLRMLVAAGVLLLAACAAPGVKAPAPADAVPAAQFPTRLTPYCGRAFPGQVREERPASPEAIWQEPMVLHLRCEGDGKLFALHLGDDRSRVWLLGQTRSGLRLSHMHHHPDGEPDAVTGYGGLAIDPAGSPDRVEFPADAASRELFARHGMDEAQAHVWALELADEGKTLIYELKRPGRIFRLAFDLSQPQTPPPLPWAEAAIR